MNLRNKSAFNLVELLITLSIVALLTTVIFNAVNDYRDKLRTVIVKGDLTTLAQMCKYVESVEMTLVETISTGATEISTSLSNYILKIPPEDPWGFQYQVITNSSGSTVVKTNSGGMAYIVDRGLGRIISPGPDGICDTKIGYGRSDIDRDIVVEYRQAQWLAFNLNGKIYLAKGDGSFEPIPVLNGVKLRVSPDKQKYVCISGGTLTWGILDENPTVKTQMQLASGGTGTYNVGGEEVFPFWAPDSVHILYTRVITGSICDIYCLNSATGLETRLTRDGPLEYNANYYQGSMVVPRAIFNDGRVSSYMYVHQTVDSEGVYITVSLDGKVAYYNRNKASLDMVLLNGTGQRTVVVDKSTSTIANRNKCRPLFWLDTETIVYLDGQHKYLYRVRQDGTYRIQMFPKTQIAGGSTVSNVTAAPYAAFSLSPDRRFISFAVNGKLEYRVIRTDGAGSIMNESAIDAPLSGILAGVKPALWPIRQTLMDNGAYERRIFIPSDGTQASRGTIHEMVLTDGGKTIKWSAPTQNFDNPDTSVVPYSWDLDKSENLIAVASQAGSVDEGKDGIFVYSVSGPSGAVTNITTNQSYAVPVAGSYFAVFWLN